MHLRTILAGPASAAAILFTAGAAGQTIPDPPPPDLPKAGARAVPALERPATATKDPSERVTVTAAGRPGHLDQANTTGSNLGLTVRETPATVDIIDAPAIRDGGYPTVQDAVVRAPGVTVGGSPADPSSFSMRGFTGDQINLLRDGVYYGPSDLVNRPENSFNLQDIEILQGPASVLYGQGAIGGVINVVTRQPSFTPTKWDTLFGYGSFGTIQSGIAVDSQVGREVAVSLAFSRTSSSGYVDHDDPNSLNVTGALAWRVRPDLQLQAGLDVVHDSLPSYYGTPLLPSADTADPQGGTIRSSAGLAVNAPTEFTNYNTADAVHEDTSVSPSLLLTWQPGGGVTLSNRSYVFYAERRWQNAETYTYIPPGSTATDAAGDVIPGNSIARDRFYVYHQQHLYGDQAHLVVDGALFGLGNRATVGIDASYLQFLRSRGFPEAGFADYVSLADPVQGSFGSFPGEFPQSQSPTQLADVAGLAEDALDLTPRLHLVTGLRDEWLRLDRRNDDQAGIEDTATGFDRTFNPTNVRVGLVGDVARDTTLYGAYTTAQDPPGSNIYLANAGQFTRLTSSSQGEVGFKGAFWDRRASATLALYTIERRNILIGTSDDTVGTVGRQSSRGAEFAGDLRVTRTWTVSADAAYTHARYGAFTDPQTGGSDAGNRPPDVPGWTAAIFTRADGVAGLPIAVGGDVRYVGDRAGDFANTLRLDAYELVDVYASYRIGKAIEVTGRIDNLLGRTYAAWADTNYPTEIILGRPRFFGLELRTTL